jgi:hypothetical protein
MKITYTGGLDEDLDKLLEIYLKAKGYELAGRGMVIESQIRDLEFRSLLELIQPLRSSNRGR